MQLSESISKLAQLTPRLNRATDKSDAIVVKVEAFLNHECSLGIPASAQVIESDCRAVNGDDSGLREYDVMSLVYERMPGGKFGIAIVVTTNRHRVIGLDRSNEPEWTDEHELERNVTPWRQASRQHRLTALPKLPDLIEALAHEVGKLVAAAIQANVTAEKLLDAMTAADTSK